MCNCDECHTGDYVPQPRLKLEYLGTHWAWGGTLFHMSHPDGRDARVYVDDLGETWVDIRRIPEGGWFHTERVDAYRVFAAATEERSLRERGFTEKRIDRNAHRVRERGI